MVWNILLMMLMVESVTHAKLNVARVLLPITPDSPVNFTLRISGDGCYIWSSSHPDVIKVIDNHDANGCSRSAVTTACDSVHLKTSAIVLAQERSTGELLSCSVILDFIHTIQIGSKTKKLLVGDPPEELRVRAFDSQGNEFSSLNGLLFQWHFGDMPKEDEAIVRWVKYADSSYDASNPSITVLEAKGRKGHSILIEALRTGSTKVTASLESDSSRIVLDAVVQIEVHHNLILEPAEAFIVPGSIVKLRLSRVVYGKVEAVSLPISNYFLDIDDPTIGSIVDPTGSFLALGRGTAIVHLRQHNQTGNSEVSAVIHVVNPYRLSLVLLPHRSWATMLDSSHIIQVDVYDEHGHIIHPVNEISVKVNIPQAFQVEEATVNGTYHFGRAIKKGVHRVKATLRSLRLPDGSELKLDPVLKDAVDLEIFDSISVVPSQKILAWDPVKRPRHEIKYGAAGSSQGTSYQFISSNTSFATIDQTGLAKTNGMGWCNISAFLPKYPHIGGEATLYVLPPISMVFQPHIVEVEKGNVIHVPVAMTARLPSGVEAPFSDCFDASLTITLSDKKNFSIGPLARDAPRIVGCRAIPVNASGVSLTKLTVTLNSTEGSVKDSILITSYRRLRYILPANREAVLALGSSRVLVFEGGPLPRFNKPSAHYRKIQVENETVATAGQLTPIMDGRHMHKDVFQVEVTCRHIGETEVTYRVGNIPATANVYPMRSSTQIKVVCVHPARIYLTPEVSYPNGSKASCPLDPATQRVVAHTHVDLKLITVVKDEHGRKLDNFSSVDIEWSLSSHELGELNINGIKTESSFADGFLVLGRSYRLFKPSGRTGSLDVTARIVGYNPRTLQELGLASQPPLDRSISSAEDELEEKDLLSYMIDLVLVENNRNDSLPIDP